MDPSSSHRRHAGSTIGGLLAVGVFALAIVLATGNSGGARRDVAERFLEAAFIHDNVGFAVELVDPERPLADAATLREFVTDMRKHTGEVKDLSLVLVDGSAEGREPAESRFRYCLEGVAGAVDGHLVVARLPAGDMGVRRVVWDATGAPRHDGRCPATP